MKLQVSISGMLNLEFLVLDLNRTIALDGQLVSGVCERFAAFSTQTACHAADLAPVSHPVVSGFR